MKCNLNLSKDEMKKPEETTMTLAQENEAVINNMSVRELSIAMNNKIRIKGKETGLSYDECLKLVQKENPILSKRLADLL